MMFVVSSITGLGLYLAEHKVASNVAQDLEREFQARLAVLHSVQQVRHASIAEHCQALVKKPRIHAALEDDAMDLLYVSARDELRDLMEKGGQSPAEMSGSALHAKFYRFLDGRGAVLSPPNVTEVGELLQEEAAQIALDRLPAEQQLGYMVRMTAEGGGVIDEIICMPVISMETKETISAIAVGFKPVELVGESSVVGINSGIWLKGHLYLPGVSQEAKRVLALEIERALPVATAKENRMQIRINGTPYLIFYKCLNPGSLYPPAYEVCTYPLTEMRSLQLHLRWQVLGLGALLLLCGLGVSHFLSGQLSAPVDKLAVDSEENRAQRQRAEAALEITSVELQRSARFSADASHQLKTPVTVMRAGLEELLVREDIGSEIRDEISELIHQTYRLTTIIEDLLLLSRMDAGRLQLELTSVNLTWLLEACADDLSARPDAAGLKVEIDVPSGLKIAGEKRYTSLIIQNLLENACKYNRPMGRIRIAARSVGDHVLLLIGNTGCTISEAAQAHIFERFHRGAIGENLPGHGLGLNLARELSLLHKGDLRLTGSDRDWTEFEVRFPMA